jgi:hypothetical protein
MGLFICVVFVHNEGRSPSPPFLLQSTIKLRQDTSHPNSLRISKSSRLTFPGRARTAHTSLHSSVSALQRSTIVVTIHGHENERIRTACEDATSDT